MPSDFSVPDYGIPGYGIPDIVFPLHEAEAAYDTVTRLLAAIGEQSQARSAAADLALTHWWGKHADYFREARTKTLDGLALSDELTMLQSRLLAALKRYEELQTDVVLQRRRAMNADRAGGGV